VGVEKTFFYQSPMIKEIKVSRSGKVRRGKLFYLRGKLTKKGARIQESKRAIKVPGEETAETAAAQTAETVAPAPVEASAPVTAPAQAETPKKD
jgi:large subunit ribosomal protein L19